jgi:hypothetical protein
LCLSDLRVNPGDHEGREAEAQAPAHGSCHGVYIVQVEGVQEVSRTSTEQRPVVSIATPRKGVQIESYGKTTSVEWITCALEPVVPHVVHQSCAPGYSSALGSNCHGTCTATRFSFERIRGHEVSTAVWQKGNRMRTAGRRKRPLRRPTLLEDFILRAKITHFDHERILERIVHARSSAAHGYFECYGSLEEYTRATVFGGGQEDAGVRPVFNRGRRARLDRHRERRPIGISPGKPIRRGGSHHISANHMSFQP